MPTKPFAGDGLVQSQERRARQFREQFHQEQMNRIKAEREKQEATKKADEESDRK